MPTNPTPSAQSIERGNKIGAQWAATLTNDALAHMHFILCEAPRSYSRFERFGLLREAGLRVRGDRNPTFKKLTP